MTAPLLAGTGLGKQFRIVENRSLAELFRRRSGPRTFWALQDVDIEAYPGEVLSVIGRNGAGKSTLLKLCAGVSAPTVGSISRPGRIAPLIEVGAGFHPELTGRENIAVNGRLLGLSRSEIKSQFDQIVEFSELGSAIDRPVRQYSSGMFMRLGFSVAIHTRPDLLIVDEVLAVGDLPFQARCMDRIREMRECGVAIVFVSHNINAVLSLSSRAVLLEKGQVLAEGDVTDVVGAYHRTLSSPEARLAGGADDATSELILESVSASNAGGHEPGLWEPGDRATLRLTLRAVGDVPPGRIGFRFDKDGVGMVARWVSEPDGVHVPALRAGELAEVELDFGLNFAEGGYTLTIAVGPDDFRYFTLVANSVYRFGVNARPGGIGVVDIDPHLRARQLE